MERNYGGKMNKPEAGLTSGYGIGIDTNGDEYHMDINGKEIYPEEWELINLKPVKRKWTAAEMEGKKLFRCEAFLTGLEPFKELEQPFVSVKDAACVFVESVKKAGVFADGKMQLVGFENGGCFLFDIFYSNGSICGSGSIKEIEA